MSVGQHNHQQQNTTVLWYETAQCNFRNKILLDADYTAKQIQECRNKFCSVQTTHQTNTGQQADSLKCQRYRNHLVHLQDSAVCMLHSKQMPHPHSKEHTESTFRMHILLGADYTANKYLSSVTSNSQNKLCQMQTSQALNSPEILKSHNVPSEGKFCYEQTT